MSLSIRELYRFQEFELNPARRTLLRNGCLVQISPKAFDVLVYLVSNHGRVVLKDELMKAVWPDSFVEDSNLTQHVSWLRKALADQSDFIVTIPGRGYQFTGEVLPDKVSDSLPDECTDCVVVHRLRERAHVVIEESTKVSDRVARITDASLGKIPPEFNTDWRMNAGSQRAKTAVILVLLLAGIISVGYFGFKKAKGTAIRPTVAVAVLPFRNLTGDPAKEYLSDGITEEMINSLTRAEGEQLRVIARTTAISFKDTRKSIPEIARELDVQYILEGGVQSEGPRLHVTTQLIRANDQSQLWGDSFDGDSGQILDFETRLTRSVAQSLSLRLTAQSTAEHTPGSTAHDAYLRGLYSLSLRSRAGFKDALRHFSTAVAEDPQYARAYAELAVTYNLMGQYNWMETEQANSQAKAAARQALAVDSSIAEAHSALGFNEWFYGWNTPAASDELAEAIRLEPTNVDAHHWFGEVLMTSRRFDDAERQMRIALALDPKSLILRTNIGWLHYSQHQFPLAIQEMQAVVRENPDFVTAHYKLWWAYSVSGDAASAWTELRIVAHLIFTSDEEKALTQINETQGYDAVLRALASSSGGYYSQAIVDDARCMAFLKDKTATLQFLERGLNEREGWMVVVESDPAFDFLRSDPEYKTLVRKLHTPSK